MTDFIFSNSTILSKISKQKLLVQAKIITELKNIAPMIENNQLLKIYDKSVSIRQGNMQGNGAFLENDIENFLSKNHIPYKKQVTINNKGIIIGFNYKKERCFHVIDFVIGSDICEGSSITKFNVLSCKTTCRERWTQDEWTYRFPPKKYILITLSDDYPSSMRFKENIRRKIISCKSKKKDDRIYKLRFEDLRKELNLGSIRRLNKNRLK